MGSITTRETRCLDVAIDHRIRRLFQPVQIESDGDSNHVSIIESHGRRLARSSGEISVTAALAGPSTTGGIAIVLQQPRHNHPFEQGLDAVIDDCDTLRALQDIFQTVSLNSLDIRTNVSVVDVLPYVSEKPDNADDAVLRSSFRTSAAAICSKEPKVVLCAGQVWLPRVGKYDDRKGEAFKIESIGVGQTFHEVDKSTKKPEVVRMRAETGKLVKIRRVNGFHPSRAVNYLLHRSCLRQLQILVAAETCGVYRDDWREEPWMIELRMACQSTLQQTRDNIHLLYIPQYEKVYSRKLRDLDAGIVNCSTDTTSLYDELLACRLSETCNDASLILRQMAELGEEGWDMKHDSQNKRALRTAASNTLAFAVRPWNTVCLPAGRDFQVIIRHGAAAVRGCVTRIMGEHPKNHLDLYSAADAFLGMAEDLETFMGDLLEQEGEQAHETALDEAMAQLLNSLEVSTA